VLIVARESERLLRDEEMLAAPGYERSDSGAARIRSRPVPRHRADSFSSPSRLRVGVRRIAAAIG
jgi:hypothetical protein